MIVKYVLEEKNAQDCGNAFLGFGNTLGFFNGVNQCYPPLRGEEVVLYFTPSRSFHFRYDLGRASNNKVNVFTLWLLLTSAKQKGCRNIQVIGDSKLVIDWASQKCHVKNIRLGPIVNIVKELIVSLDQICFSHIYGKLNSIAYELSKQEILCMKEPYWIQNLVMVFCNLR